MPGKTQQRKQRKNKRGQRGDVSKSGVVGLTTLRVGLPDRFRVTMPYSTFQIYAPAAGASATYSWRGNSVFDPDFSGAGVTAFTYTQLSALYNRYRVIGSKIVVDVLNTGTTTLSVTLQASISNFMPSHGNVFAQKHIAEGSIAPGGPVAWKHSASAQTNKIFGVPKAQVLSEDDFAGLVGGNPNNVWYWHIGAYNPGAAAGAASVRVRIDFDVVWSMPLQVAP